ncbi:hypothetical protein PNEG_03454 [Pneumocystis murina B123]|uniref:Peptidase M16 N-terminal domain-containing protein n=1 Tax=Pneumocystis murina (strain B123) TaxID=1069680 RepID=M7NLD9_PNEMU|nr:hypothetical protein PNEG_03454 [Pneumocystis murina B123]EMR08012.1 hypothetical protein PNEG_03454 [Pneumocystis murina B123]
MRFSSLLLLSFTFITQYTKSNKLPGLNNTAKDSNSNYDPSHIKVIETDFEKSLIDDSEYRVIKLKNGLEAILVSDPHAQVSSTALSIRIGHRYDPKEFPGLAHLCEHLLFMGTKKYPGKDSYNRFLHSHGGAYNAYTSLDRTSYMSDVSPRYHYEQLDRMANFFIEPLFLEDAIERETHSVNSEFEMYSTRYVRARYQILCHMFGNSSFFPRFTTGNRQTLFSGPRARNLSTKQALHDFFNKYYRPHDMKLAIYGNESLDVYQEWAQSTFGQIPDRGVRVDKDINPFSFLPKHHFWFGYPDMSPALSLVFFVPSSGIHYKSIPYHYLDYVFTYPGHKSPLYYFSRLSLASSIELSLMPYSQSFNLLFVNFVLLPLGKALYTEVIGEFFKCLQFFKDTGPNEEVFEEIRKAQRNEFLYSFKGTPFNYAEDLSVTLLSESFPRKHVLNRFYLKEYDKEEILDFFSYLNPHNFISFVNMNKKFNETEPFYGIPYLKEHYSEKFIESLKNPLPTKLQYPPKNVYISTNIQITMEKLNETLSKPDILRASPITTLWYKHGSFFYCPYGIIRVLLRSQFISSSPTNLYKLRFLQVHLYTSLSYSSFYTTMAGLDFSITTVTQGVLIYIYGFSDKIMEIFSKIIALFKDLSITAQEFGRLKSVIFTSVAHRSIGEPGTIVDSEIDDILFSEKTPLVNLVLLSEQFFHPDIAAFFYDFLSNLHIDVLITGNVPPQDALHVFYMMEAVFHAHPLTPSQYINNRAIDLDSGSDYYYTQKMYNKERKSALLVYLQVAESNNMKRVQMLYLLFTILRGFFFSQMRTKEQLGYYVTSNVRISKTILGISFLIQSERQPHVLHSRFDAFFDNSLDILLNITPKEFDYYLDAYNVMFKRTPIEISSETSRSWISIIEGTYVFEYDKPDDPIESIKLQDIIELLKELRASKKRISYYAYSQINSDIYNVFDMPISKLSKYLASKGEKISEEELHEYVLLSHNVSSFRANLFGHLIKNKDNDTAESFLNETFQFLQHLYNNEKKEILKSYTLIEDITYFKANMSLSSGPIRKSLWSKYYR